MGDYRRVLLAPLISPSFPLRALLSLDILLHCKSAKVVNLNLMLCRPVKYVSWTAVHSFVYFCCTSPFFTTSIEGVAMLGL